MDNSTNEAVLRAVSAAADMADTMPPDGGPAKYAWHRAFLAELGEQGYRIVTDQDHETLRLAGRCSICRNLPTEPDENDPCGSGYPHVYPTTPDTDGEWRCAECRSVLPPPFSQVRTAQHQPALFDDATIELNAISERVERLRSLIQRNHEEGQS
jgi:hypothetical protein